MNSRPPAEDQLDELLHAARAERAPDALRTRVQALRRPASRPARRSAPRRARFGAGLAGALAVTVAALVVLLPGGAGSPTVAQAAALALHGPVTGPPGADPRAARVRLAQSVGEVYFPNWTRSLGWRATGQRTDRLRGHRAVTVFYRRGRAEIAYTIVGLPALREPSAPTMTVAGVPVRSLRVAERTIVTWRRGGETCIISTRSATLAELRTLAAWRDAAPLS